MPTVREIVCANEDCELDMFSLHYTYDMPDEVDLLEFVCPYCERGEFLREIALDG